MTSVCKFALFVVFFFKQKTAYEMRISDWSSDVCSSDLTLGVDKLPGGRGFGEPLRLMMGLPNDQDIVAVFVHQPERTLFVASSDGRGFLVPEDEVVAQTKNGKQVLNPGAGVEAAVCRHVQADNVAAIGEDRQTVVSGKGGSVGDTHGGRR